MIITVIAILIAVLIIIVVTNIGNNSSGNNKKPHTYEPWVIEWSSGRTYSDRNH